MSNKLKHAKRSQRSYNKSNAIFTAFKSRAQIKFDTKAIKESNTFDKMMSFFAKALGRKHQGR